MIKDFLDKTIEQINFTGGLNPYIGKVRHCYDSAEGHKLLVTSDRLSAFDRQITTIPFKGQVLTQISKYWFETTKDICPNHMIDCPDPNIMVCQDLKMLPVELVVRGYLAGSTGTSILTMYKQGRREIYGAKFPDGMKDFQKLDQPIITPTTKAASGGHDAPLSAEEIVANGILEKEIWNKVSDYALALFARGQEVAKRAGLILADTKYEFGIAPDGTIMIGDEMHTPDSSRYWIAETYEARLAAGEPPKTLDKDMVRRWLVSKIDPYKDDIPIIPDDLRAATGEIYIDVFEKITQQKFDFPDPAIDPQKRVCKALQRLSNSDKAA